MSATQITIQYSRTKQTEKEVGRQHQGIDRPTRGPQYVPEESGEQRVKAENDVKSSVVL